MRPWLFAAILLTLAPIADAPAASLDAIRARGTLRVGVTGDYPPFSFRVPADGRFEGFDVEQAQDLAKALGVSLEFVGTSWLTLAADLTADTFDIAMGGVSVTPDRAAHGRFSAPYLHDGKTPVARCAEGGRFDTVEAIDKPDVRVVVNPGGTNERFARARFPHARIRCFRTTRASSTRSRKAAPT